jgi:endonuclease III
MAGALSKISTQKIFENLASAIPHPKSELNFNSDFQLLAAVLLSAHTTDVSVNKATAELFKIAPTPAAMLKLGIKRLKPMIRSVGLYQAKAKNLIATSKILLDKYGSKLPRRREELEALPGVGRKTANVILNIAFGEPTIAVDTHVFRVANRTHLAIGKNPLAVEAVLLKVVPKKFLKVAHYLLLLHGRYVCTARNPKCASCVICKWCKYEKKSDGMPSRASSYADPFLVSSPRRRGPSH